MIVLFFALRAFLHKRIRSSANKEGAIRKAKVPTTRPSMRKGKRRLVGAVWYRLEAKRVPRGGIIGAAATAQQKCVAVRVVHDNLLHVPPTTVLSTPLGN